jgi:hypothetical protein
MTTMKTMRRHLTAGLAGIALLAALAAALAGCGGGSVGVAAGGVKVAAAPAGPPLDFSFRPPEAPMLFGVDLSSEAEMMGTSFISSFRYQWEAKSWQADGENWTADVRFSKLSAAQRRGSGVGMEPQEEVKQLEGFTARYRKDKSGFAPVARPAKDKQFLAIFDQLQGGLSPLDLKLPAEAPRLGASWPEPLGDSALDMLRPTMKDSTITFTYAADERFQGRDCARLHYQGKIELDGVVSAPAGSEGGSARITGHIEVEGSGYYDKARGFLLQDVGKAKFIINQRALDAKGEPSGPEQSIVQNLNYTVKYLGS